MVMERVCSIPAGPFRKNMISGRPASLVMQKIELRNLDIPQIRELEHRGAFLD
jgi:hypothetical protein